MKISNPFKNLLKKSFIMLAMKCIGALISFLLTAMITRELGAEESGSYFFIISTVLFVCSVTSLGFNNAVIKLGSLEDKTKKYCRLLGDMTLAVLFSSFVSIVFIYLMYKQ